MTTTPLRDVTFAVTDESLASRATVRWLELLGARRAGDAGIVARVAGPGGDDGDERALAESLWARSGLAAITWAEGGETPGASCLPTTSLPQELAAAAAALAACAAALDPNGAPCDVTVDALETLTLLPMQPLAAAQLPASTGARGGAIGAHVGGTVATADGLLYLRLVEPEQWDRLLAEVPGALDGGDSLVDDPARIDREAAHIDAAVRAWAATRSTEQVLVDARRLRVPIAPFVPPDQLARDEHLVARGYADGEAVDLRAPWIVVQRRPRRPGWRAELAPAVGQPLRGLRVFDLTWAWAGPFATTLLAELGAEVINLEWHPRPSNLRVQLPMVDGFGVDGGGWWSANQRGKRSVALDLKDPEALAVALDIAATCDAAIENFSPHVVDRLGLGFDALVERNPNLVYVSMSAYGASGPRATERGYGPHLYASAGYAELLRAPGGGLSQMGIPVGDPISGLVAALGLVAHLSGDEAVHLDVSELEATCAVRGTPLGASTRARPPIATIAETLDDPSLVEHGAWTLDRAAAMSGLGIRIARAPWRFDGERSPEPTGAPRLGQDTRSVLREIAGRTDEQIDTLVERGAALAPAD